MRVGSALVIAVLAACDPGGRYHVPGGIPQGTAFVLGAGAQTSLLARASWFTSSLDVSLAITNRGTTPLEVRPDAARIADREGAVARNESQPVFHCRDRDGEVVTLAPGETCELEMTFRVDVDKDRLARLTLSHDGLTRGGVAVPVRVIFVLD